MHFLLYARYRHDLRSKRLLNIWFFCVKKRYKLTKNKKCDIIIPTEQEEGFYETTF